MQRRIKAMPLQENRYNSAYPSPTVRSIALTDLNGGLNLWELDYKLNTNQSPDLENVYWKDGCLSSRGGQQYVYSTSTSDFCACYDKLWHDYIIAQKDTVLYKISPLTGTHTSILTGLTKEFGGSFFVFGDKLYYMNGHEYIQINSSVVASKVTPYIPTVIVNRQPDGTGGSTYEDENRLSPKKLIEFTADGTAVAYQIPTSYTPLDSTGVIAKLKSPSVTNYIEVQTVGSLPSTGYPDIYYYYSSKYYRWNGSGYTEVTAPASSITFTVNRTTGVITFNTAPAASSLIPSNLDITISKTNQSAINNILNCTCATVYGGDTDLMVVCGGTSGQLNAYFWSGNTNTGVDPTYFPMSNYNYAGSDSGEAITGFGRQQSMLVIFKERSIGKTAVSTTTINNLTKMNLPYNAVNDSIGCDIPKSIQLVQNNLVFANTYGGVYVLTDTTAAGENSAKRISRNINGDMGDRKGLLYDLSQLSDKKKATSFDDNQRYWLIANGKAYLWDYTVKGYTAYESNLSWFRFTGINSVASVSSAVDDRKFFNANGYITEFIEQYADFGSAFNRKYVFATQYFGSYENLKDVLKVVISTGTITGPAITLSYKTDYEEREDRTVLNAVSWRLSPRDLTQRALRSAPFAKTFVRKPMCWHVRHFQMAMTNNILDAGMSIMSAQIFYRYAKEDR